MKSHFTSEFFVANRARLRELFQGTAPIVITANGLLQRGGDSSFTFAQDANFWYLTGIDESDLVLVLDRDREYLVVPERSDSRQAFDGSIDDEALRRRSGIKDIYSANVGWELLAGRLKKVKHLASLAPAPAYIDQYGLYANPARAALLQKVKALNPDIEVLDLSLHMARMRMVKQAPELVAIQSAIDITLATIKDVSKPAKLAKYGHEYEVEADITRGFRRRGATGHSFEPIVASGGRAVTLHNVANNGPLAAADLLIMDVGAEVEHYAADITRTVSLGTPTKRQKAVHAAVYDVQQYAMSLLKPGVLLHDYEQDIEHFMGEKLRELGLIKSISHDAVRKYYPHATSHYLGLNVHDAGEYERPLEAGVVITVEPGIYIPEEGIGIRIEDDVLITSKGCKLLSAKLSGSLT
jgi:Xaa-Pro aminopeptidase